MKTKTNPLCPKTGRVGVNSIKLKQIHWELGSENAITASLDIVLPYKAI
jgi:hypothetical protein